MRIRVSIGDIRVHRPTVVGFSKKQGYRVIRALCEMIRDEAKRSMKWAKPKGTPSMPGTPPNRQTGKLANMVHASSLGVIERDGKGYVVSRARANGVDYGAIHELGGRKHPPRPFLRPAYNRVARDPAAIDKAARRAGIKVVK